MWVPNALYHQWSAFSLIFLVSITHPQALIVSGLLFVLFPPFKKRAASSNKATNVYCSDLNERCRDSINATTMPDGEKNGKTIPGVKRLTWGIFDIAYVPLKPSILPQFSISSASTACTLCSYMFKLFLEVYRSSPFNAVLFVVCQAWICTGPVVSLYLASRTLRTLGDMSVVQLSSRSEVTSYTIWATCWFASAGLTTFAHRKFNSLTNCLAGHLRARILPRLAAVSLRLDMRYTTMRLYDTPFQHESWHFGTVPQMDILRNFFTRLGDVFRVTLELPMAIWILYQVGDRAAHLYALMGVLTIIFSIYSPMNWIGGAGYAFWTTHPAFYKLHALYSMVFELCYRETICKDGIAKRLENEFRKASEELGPHDIDTWRLASYIKPIPWYWEIGQEMILKHPMVIFAGVSLCTLSTSSLFFMAMIQYAACTMRADFYLMRGGHGKLAIGSIMKQAQTLYETIEQVEEKRTFVPYPSSTSNAAGMKISLKNIHITYEEKPNQKTVNAVVDVSVNIEPGQLVVVVGSNGSGKSSLLKLLPKLTQPSSGDVLIDDLPITEYDIHELHNSMAILSQEEMIFPLSVRDNMLISLTEPAWRSNSRCSRGSLDDLVERASKLGGSWDIMRNVGPNTILKPISVIRRSMACIENGEIASATHDECDRCAPSVRPTAISGGEKQRLLATRTITRVLNNDNIKLIIADEPSSALDPIAERDLFDSFLSLRKGRTVIFVTHRFRHLVEKADLILCMAGGKVVEHGTHVELLKADGEYARLCNAQTQVTT
ncbi:hypothetical protein AX15_001425 [Amanita polypyramis BW_CC]|nr:hypothetical protein AX15_001425 [Amanita polypyramis BW_CC]